MRCARFAHRSSPSIWRAVMLAKMILAGRCASSSVSLRDRRRAEGCGQAEGDTLAAPNKLNLDKKELEGGAFHPQCLASVLQSVPGLSRAARDEANDAADREMRGAYSDYGVVP